MARVARVVIPGVAHHITQRGNRRLNVFFSDKDYRLYLKLLQKYSSMHHLKIWAYCLMPNHIHLIGVPERNESLAESLRGAHTLFALSINQAQGWTGHLWQNRYFSCPLDDAHLYAAVKYVEQNPVRAGIVKNARDYPWSSARVHIIKQTGGILSRDCPLAETITDWEKWLQEGISFELIEVLRSKTRTGRPLGDESFLYRIEKLLSRDLHIQRRGRPKTI